jgi:hypothetical protein
MAGNAIPIKVFKVVGAGDAQPQIRRIIEEASMTFKVGTPVRVNAASGCIVAFAGNTTNANGNVAGIAAEPASNLSSNATPKTTTYGSVQGHANASLIPLGAPLNLGDVGVLLAVPSTIFVAKCNDAHYAVVTDVGRLAGLTLDTNGYFFLETEANNVTSNNSAIGVITELVDANNTAGGKLAFKMLDYCQQLSGRNV